MRGGRTAGPVLLATALVALPLIGLALLAAAGRAPTPAAPAAAVLRMAPGQGSDAVAFRPVAEADPMTRAAAGARHPGLPAVLLGAAAGLGLVARRTAPRTAVVALRPGRRVPAAGRGPPHLLPH
jgi:hypothetical protein